MSDKKIDTAAYYVPISGWPEGERPREKLLTKGAETLSDAELLAILLRMGTKKHSALDVARQLLLDGKGLAGIADKSIKELQQMPLLRHRFRL